MMEASQLNSRNARGETYLARSIRKGRSIHFIISLIESGCDVNISDNHHVSPLHLAMSCRTSEVPNKLIKAGANINALNTNRETPLHYAVMIGNLDMVDMLLYYGADVSIRSTSNGTPLMENDGLEIFQTLIRHYDEHSCISITQRKEDIMVERAAFTDLIPYSMAACQDTFVLGVSMYFGIPELFQLIWKRLDHGKLLVGKKPFLVTYWQSTLASFTTSNWLDCLYTILSSPYASRFVAHCYNKYQQRYLPALIQAFGNHDVNKKPGWANHRTFLYFENNK